MLQALEAIQKSFNASQSGGKQVSLADLIVLGGSAAIEQAAKKAGRSVDGSLRARAAPMPRRSKPMWSPSRYLEPVADGFRNYLKGRYAVPAEELLVDKAQLLTLTAPEMTVLIGGLRVLDANAGKSQHGVFTTRPETLDQRLLRQPAGHGH